MSGFLEQGQSSLEEQHGTEGIDIEVFLQIRGFDPCSGTEGLRFANTGIGNDNVNIGDLVLVLKFFDYSRWIGDRGAVQFDDDEVA